MVCPAAGDSLVKVGAGGGSIPGITFRSSGEVPSAFWRGEVAGVLRLLSDRERGFLDLDLLWVLLFLRPRASDLEERDLVRLRSRVRLRSPRDLSLRRPLSRETIVC